MLETTGQRKLLIFNMKTGVATIFLSIVSFAQVERLMGLVPSPKNKLLTVGKRQSKWSWRMREGQGERVEGVVPKVGSDRKGKIRLNFLS